MQFMINIQQLKIIVAFMQHTWYQCFINCHLNSLAFFFNVQNLELENGESSSDKLLLDTHWIPESIWLGTNLIHDFMAVTFSVKLVSFREKCPFLCFCEIRDFSWILTLLLSFMKVFIGGCSFWQPVQADSQPKSSGLVLGRRPLGAILHSSNELGELSQWLCSAIMTAP